MKDDSATADPSAKDKDSAISPEVEENPSTGHSPETMDTEEDTSENENNEEDPKDPDSEAPEGESEEEDPLLKAKKHADRKIAELGDRASTSEKKLIAATIKNPELLIEMYDPSSELYDRKLAEKISSERPDVYARADASYQQRRNGGYVLPSAAPSNPQNQTQITDALIDRKVNEALMRQERVFTEKSAIQDFKRNLGYTDEQFTVIEPNLRAIASSIREADESVDIEASLKRAFIAMFPGDYEKSVRQKTLMDAAKKKAMISPAGSGESPSSEKKTRRLSPEDEAAWKTSGLTRERYLEIQEKYFRK